MSTETLIHLINNLNLACKSLPEVVNQCLTSGKPCEDKHTGTYSFKKPLMTPNHPMDVLGTIECNIPYFLAWRYSMNISHVSVQIALASETLGV